MKNKKSIFAHICAYLSLGISITIIVLWCCNVGGFTVVSLDSFVGIIVALLAIIVTFAIGWQIYNVFEIKAQLKEISILKEKLYKQEYENEEQICQMRHLISASMAENEINRGDYITAFLYLMESLDFTMSLEAPLNTATIFEKMEQSTAQIQKGTHCDILVRIKNLDNNIQHLHNYILIKERYEKIYNDFISKVKDVS